MVRRPFGQPYSRVFCVSLLLLYKVSREATNASKEQARAVVAFGGLGIGPSINDANGVWAGQQFQVNWNNSGTLPGKSAILQQKEEPFFKDLPSGFDFPSGDDKTQGVVPPKGTYAATFTIPRNQLEDNWRGKARIFLWGEAIYKDGFSDDPIRISEFCTEIYQVTVGYVTPPVQPKTVKPTPIPPATIGAPNTAIISLSWKSCPRGVHNCYDEDCSDYGELTKDIAK